LAVERQVRLKHRINRVGDYEPVNIELKSGVKLIATVRSTPSGVSGRDFYICLGTGSCRFKSGSELLAAHPIDGVTKTFSDVTIPYGNVVGMTYCSEVLLGDPLKPACEVAQDRVGADFLPWSDRSWFIKQ
jgi:hypothetical protein